MQNYISFYINGLPHKISTEDCFLNLADYLRYHKSLTGTKIVCAEGDCGACTVLISKVYNDKHFFESTNSCILPLFLLNGTSIVTVEGLQKGEILHPVQKSMVDNFGAQCGYCTPGFVCAMTSLAENSLVENNVITEKKAKNYLTGNLCRCTGYEPIIKAATSIELNAMEPLSKRYLTDEIISSLKSASNTDILIKLSGDLELFLPATLDTAKKYLSKNPNTKIVAGATDLGVARNKGKLNLKNIMSLYRINPLHAIFSNSQGTTVSALVNLTDLQDALFNSHPVLSELLNVFASPQIKNQGTLVGNVLNGSPIGDTIPYLMAIDAEVILESDLNNRKVLLKDFYTGYRKSVLLQGELVTGIFIPHLKSKQKVFAFKPSQRRDLDISTVTVACSFEDNTNKVDNLRLALGGVGPTVIRLPAIESKFSGSPISKRIFDDISNEVLQNIQPISDVRGSREFRKILVSNLIKKVYVEYEAQK